MPKNLTVDDARLAGIVTNFREMDDGDQRFQLAFDDGASVTLSHNNYEGWQNSHYHLGAVETTAILSKNGWVGRASLVNGELIMELFTYNQLFTSHPCIPHNLYISAGCRLGTIKYGVGRVGEDWHSSPELDLLTRHLNVDDIFRLAVRAQY